MSRMGAYSETQRDSRSWCAVRERASTTPTARSTSTASRDCSPTCSATAAPTSPRRRPSQIEHAGLLPAVDLRPPARRSNSPRSSPSLAPGDLNRVFFTTGGCRGRTRARGSSRASTTRCAATPTATRSSVATSPITARRWARSPSRRSRATAQPFEPLVPGAVKVPADELLPRRRVTPTTSRPSACGRPTRSKRRSCARVPRPSPRSSSSRCRTPAAASRPPPGYWQRGARDLRPLRRASSSRTR